MADKDVKIVLTATDRTKAAFNSAQQGMNRLNSAATGMGRALGLALPALGVAGFAAFAKSSIDAADGMNDLSQKLGVSVKDLASFKLAAEQSGTSLEGIGNGIARLTRSIGEAEGGNKKLAKALQDLGITARDPKEAFLQLADATEKIADPAKRAALLSQVLGKSYQDLVPLLAQGGDELRKSALASESFADAMARLAPEADRFNDELARLKIEAAGAAGELLAKLIPGLADTATRVRELLDEDKGIQALVRALAGLGKIPFDIIFGDIKAADTAQARIRELNIELGQLQRNKASGDGKLMQMIFGTPEEIDQQITVVKNQIEALEKFGDKVYKPKTGAAAKPGAGAETDFSKAFKATGGSKADPLASLLGQTDIGRTQEYNRLLGLLNVRFKNGTKDAELYQQAVAILNKQFGKTQIDVFGNGAFKTTDSGVADFIKQQTADFEALQKGIIPEDIAKLDELLAGADFSKVLQDQQDMVLLARAFTDGIVQADGSLKKLSEAEYLDAVNARLGTSVEKIEELDVFAKRAAENIQDSFADFLFDPFENGLQGMADSFAKTVQRMVAEALAADLAKALFGDLVGGGEGSGMMGDLFKNLFGGGSSGGGMPSMPGSDQNILGSFASLFGFANGGVAAYGRPIDLPRFAGGGVSNSAAIFGEAGPEAAVPLPDGRNIPVKFKNGGGGSTVVQMNITTPDANSFRASEGQIVAQMTRAMQRGRRNL